MGRLEHDLGVNLVGHHPKVVAPGYVRYAGKRFFAHHHAGGIAGRREEDRTRSGRDRPLQRRQIKGEIQSVNRNGDEFSPRRPNRGLIGQVHGFRHEDFVPLLTQALGHAIERVLGARRDNHLTGADPLTADAVMVNGYGLAQGLAARNIGIVGVARVQGCYRRLADRVRGGEVRIADAEHKHLFAAPTRRQGFDMDFPGVDRLASQSVHPF